MYQCEILNSQHDRQSFDCDNEALNRYLKQYANQYNKHGISKTYVLTMLDNPHKIVGFFSLSSLHIDPKQYQVELANLPPNMEIPCILIGRLAIDKTYIGQGLSRLLLSHALHLVKQAFEIIAVSLVIVDAKNDELTLFYEKLGFTRIPNSLRLFLPVKKIN